MEVSGQDPSWDDDDDSARDGDQSSYPLLPPSDRLWRHPSEASPFGRFRRQDDSDRRGRWNRRAARRTLSLAAVAITAGATGTWAYNTAFVSPQPKPTGSQVDAISLPAGISQKIARISSAVTEIKSPTGSLWQAATFINSSNYLVTSAGGLTTDEILLERVRTNAWQRLWVAAVDPLTGSAILQTTQPSPRFLSNYVKEAPQAGALDELVYPRKSSSGVFLKMAEVVSSATPLALGAKIYIPNTIELDTVTAGVPLGTLVLDPEGDPVGIVVKSQATPHGSKLFATPLPSIARITNLIKNHMGILHGYLGVVGKTVTNAGNDAYAGGVQIISIASGSPAEKAKLPIGSVIVTVNGAKIDSLPALQSILLSSEPGSTVSVGVENSGLYASYRLALANHP